MCLVVVTIVISVGGARGSVFGTLGNLSDQLQDSPQRLTETQTRVRLVGTSRAQLLTRKCSGTFGVNVLTVDEGWSFQTPRPRPRLGILHCDSRRTSSDEFSKISLLGLGSKRTGSQKKA